MTTPLPAAADSAVSSAKVQSIGVVGGGTSGYFAALALKKAFPQLRVCVVESSAIPIIGVGEATTTLMPPFLHAQLGIDPVELFAEVEPTWKLGIRFDWGPQAGEFFPYPFGPSWPIEAHTHDRHIRDQSFTAMLMAQDRAPILQHQEGAQESLLPWLKFAYHLDNKRFVGYLAKLIRRAGIEQIDAVIQRARRSPHGRDIEALELADGRELRFDLYVDASGFRSLIMGEALESPFIDYKSSLFCDTALVAEMPNGGLLRPYTQAETMEAGWCWRIPVRGEDHRGYVFSSQFLSVDQAEAEMRAKNPQMGSPWLVRFRSGRHQDFWQGNVAALGNAYGFVEPLESTALHMVIIELAYLIGGLRAGGDLQAHQAHANQHVGGHWDYLRWFLALHYKFNQRLESPFWQACRREVDVSGLQGFLEDFAERGPWRERSGLAYPHRDPAFSYEGLMILLLGQKVACPAPAVAIDRESWQAQTRARRDLAELALPQAQALALLQRRPEMLAQLMTEPGSWLSSGEELLLVRPELGESVHPQARPTLPPGPYADLLTGRRGPPPK